MREEFCEYFEQVLGVSSVILPPPNVSELGKAPSEASGPGPEAKNLVIDPAGGETSLQMTSDKVTRADRQPAESVVFVELATATESFFDDCADLFQKMTTAMKLAPDQISRIQMTEMDWRDLQPKKFFVLMGWPEQSIFGQTVESFRGQWMGRGLVTYHPGHLKENIEAKKMAWNDLQRVMREL